jgi:hypothetical protein
MKRALLRFTLRSWWHAGTGRGVSSTLDSIVARDADGLPYLPGRSVKGLLRDAVSQWEYWETVRVEEGSEKRSGASDALTNALFGGRAAGSDGASRYDTTPGVLDVRSARVDGGLSAGLLADPDRARLVAGLTATLRSTAVAHDRGTAVPHSLRAIEVAVPLTLYADVEEIKRAEAAALKHPRTGEVLDWVTVLKEAAGFLQGVGMHRQRGLGRVEVSVEESGGYG